MASGTRIGGWDSDPHATGPNITTDRARRVYIFNLTASDVPDDRLQDLLRADHVRNPGKVRVS